MTAATTYTGVLLAIAALALGLWAHKRLLPESAPVARGGHYAGVRGCVDCHGDPGNPLPDANDARCSDVNPFSWHPEYETDCADAMAYFEAIRLRRNLAKRVDAGTDKLLVKGEALAREYHCFQCHGQLGQGGFRNKRSLKGYVPGYFGSDFDLLTRDGSADSVRDWITHGMDSAMVDQPMLGRIAAFFFGRQAVSMPSFASLPPGEIEILVNYVITVHEFGPMSAEAVRAYGKQSVSMEGLAHVDIRTDRQGDSNENDQIHYSTAARGDNRR